MAFEGCTSLQMIDLPNSVTTISRYAFSDCCSLESIDIPNSVKEIGEAAFHGCTSLKTIDIPNSVTIIGKGAFSGCTSLKNVNIPNSVTEINGIFNTCISIESVDIPDSVMKIGGWTFHGCSSLRKICIPNSVTEIGEFAFNRSSLEELEITSNTFEIGEHAICNCPIRRITVDKANPVYFSIDDVLFKKLEGEKNFLVKYAPKKEGEKYCIDENTIMLNSCAFKNAKELEEIVLHEGILSLGEEQTFAFCTSLKQLILPSCIRIIPERAFSGCSSLKEVALPNSDNYSIKDLIFQNCHSLTAIHSSSEKIDNIEIDEKAFDGFDIDECTLYIPSGTRWAYRHHPGFGKFKNIEIEKMK